MLNLKLQTIAKFVNQEDIVLDTCCDHAYLAIYLKKHNLCRAVYASDISSAALIHAKKNIKASHVDLPCFVADGLKGLDIKNLNTVIIAGVGANTVFHIFKTSSTFIPKFIISSNNNHASIRKFMLNSGYQLTKEEVVLDNNKYYPIMVFEGAKKPHLSKAAQLFGFSNNHAYYTYLLKKEEAILKRIPKTKIASRIKHQKNIFYLRRLIKKTAVDYS